MSPRWESISFNSVHQFPSPDQIEDDRRQIIAL